MYYNIKCRGQRDVIMELDLECFFYGKSAICTGCHHFTVCFPSISGFTSSWEDIVMIERNYSLSKFETANFPITFFNQFGKNTKPLRTVEIGALLFTQQVCTGNQILKSTPRVFLQNHWNQSNLQMQQHRGAEDCHFDIFRHCGRAPSKRGRYWEIHPLCPRDFPQPSLVLMEHGHNA